MTRQLTLAVATALVLTACGSTVQQTGVAADPTGVNIGTGLGPPPDVAGSNGEAAPGTTSGPDQTVAVAGPTDSAGTRAAGTPGAPQTDGSSGTGTGTNRTAPTGGGGRLPGRHRAVSDSTIKVGFLYLANAGTVAGTFGVKGYSQGDELEQFRVLVADQNARGGVAGRKLAVVPRDLGGIDEASVQAACTYFTQDSPVFMVFSALGHGELLNSCLAKGSVGFTSNYIAPPDRLMRGLGSVYAPDDIAAERYGALLGRSLVDNRILQRGTKVGIIRADTPDYARITKQILRPILVSAGVEVVAEEAYHPTDASKSIGDAGGVVFRMRSAGVTHVVSYESPLFYMTAAESQGWRPWWTVTSRAGPGAFLEGGAAPAEQLKKSGGPGWQPVSDIASARLKGYINSEEERCLTTLRKAGHNYSGTPRYVGQMLCGELYHFVRAHQRATEVSTAGFRAAAESLAPYPSPMTFGMSFAGGRHDGAAAYRIVAYQSSCSCYAYTSAIQPMPSL